MDSLYPEKAYKNLDFLNSASARPIRILCEYEEPRQRFEVEGVHSTVPFFGSARTKSAEDAQAMLKAAEAAVAAGDAGAEKALKTAQVAVRMSRYYEDARELGRLMTEYGLQQPDDRRCYVCSGGGPGIMEAANRGASEVEGGRSVGLGISLPFEKGINKYVTPELGFEFHYFFTRKYWFLYLAKALVVFPGGFGTLDELAETLTLVQTGKISKPLPIILYGTDYWNEIMNLERMADFGTISPEDIDLFYVSDSVEDSFEYLKARLS